MKRILYTCLAALAAAYTAPAADEPAESNAPAAPAAESAPPAGETPAAAEEEEKDVAAFARRKLDEAAAIYGSLEKPNRVTRSSYERLVADINDHLGKLDEAKKQVEELETKKMDAAVREYTLSVPAEERDKYEREGGELAKKAISSLNAKGENSQIEGLRMFETLRETYQGVPDYKEARSLYQKTVNKFSRKWSTLREGMKRERQKWPASRLDKTLENENLQFTNLARKMESKGLNIEEDWFVPVPNNSVMLDRALDRAKRAASMLQNKSVESAPADVTALIREFWSSMESASALISQGKLEEASALVADLSVYREISSVGRHILPDVFRDNIKKQYEEVRSEVRERQNAVRNVEREISRAMIAHDREVSYLKSRIERMMESVEMAKEEEARRAAEAAEEAAREAEREAELKAEEERLAKEAAEDDEDDEAAKPKKKKGGKKKKKAE